ncbi:MAG: phosphatase domain-containing protein [bacterium]
MLIDWLPSDILPSQGRLGLTHMPGSRAARDSDLAALQRLGVDALVCLQQPREFQQINPPETLAERETAVQAHQIQFVHDAITDFAPPTIEQAQRIVTKLKHLLDEGQTVVVHCFAGLGRAGTIAACVLVAYGHRASDAVKLVREYRKGAVQTQAQAAFVQQFAQALGAD